MRALSIVIKCKNVLIFDQHLLAVKETEIAYAKLCEKYLTTKAAQATAAWKQTKVVLTSTQAVLK